MGKALVGAEDLALGKHGKVFIGAGDIYDTFYHGAANAVPGGVYVFDVASLPAIEPARLELTGFPKEEGAHFQVHGIFVSNATDRLYTVTHRGAFSSVEIFAIRYDISSAGVSLQFVRSVRSDLFPNGGTSVCDRRARVWRSRGVNTFLTNETKHTEAGLSLGQTNGGDVGNDPRTINFFLGR